MFPVDVSQFYGALKIAYKVYNIGWNDIHDAHRLHREFGDDIQTLAQNLNNLVSVINRAQKGHIPTSRPSSETTVCLNQILGNFEDTLRECLQLLENNQVYGERKGAAYNIAWYMRVKDEVDQLRDRIAFLNIKLSIVLKSLDVVTGDGLRILILESTNLILNRIELSETRALGITNIPQPASRNSEPSASLVPPEIDGALKFIAPLRFGHLPAIGVVQGIDEVVFLLDRATQWHLRREPSVDSTPLVRVASVITACWMLQITKNCDEYRITLNNGVVTSFDEFELQMVQWGMTTKRFLRQLEKNLVEAQRELVESGLGTIPVSSVVDFLHDSGLDCFSRSDQSPQVNDDNPRQGTRLLRCGLQGNAMSPNRTLEIYRPPVAGNGTNLVVITGGTGRPERIYEIDVTRISIIPKAEAFDSGAECYNMVMKGDKNTDGSSSFDLSFKRPSDLFKFQGIGTGFKMVKDFPSMGATMRIATLFNGKEKRYSGRAQLWSPASRQDFSSSVVDLLSSSLTKTSLRKENLSNDSIVSRAPVLPPIRISQDSISLPSLTRASTEASTLSLPSIVSGPPVTSRPRTKTPSRPASVTTDLSTLREKNPGDLGIVIEDTEPPRLVMLLQSTAGAKSMVIVDMDERLTVNKDRCHCSNKEDGGCVCRRIFLQSTRGDIRAMESVGAVNLAAAGRHQRCEGMVPLKGLTLLTLELASYEHRASFIRYFDQLQKLRSAQARKRLVA